MEAELSAGYARRVLASMPDLVLVIDGNGQVRFVSAAAERLLGWDPAAWVGRSGFELVHPDDLAMALVSLESVSTKDVGNPIDVRVLAADGSWRHLEVIGTNHLHDPSIGGVVLAARDVTERRRFEVASGEQERFRSLVQHSAAITMQLTEGGVITSLSAAFARILGHDPEWAIGSELARWAVPHQQVYFRERIAEAAQSAAPSTFDALMIHRDRDEPVPLQFNVVNLLDDPVVEGLVVTASDITPIRDAQAALAFSAKHDSLTQLPNRVLLLEHLNDTLVRAAHRGPVTVFYIDLDHFKRINDLQGHEAGDHVLRTVADRIRHAARDGDLVARIGGDEFVVVAEQVKGTTEASDIAQRLEEAVAEPITLGAGEFRVIASTGMARSEPDSTPETLLTDADGAMYLTKAERRGEFRRTVYRVSQRRAIAEALASALRDDQLRVHYQPIIDLRTERVAGFEALVRWDHPEYGLLYPGDFLSVAEEADLDTQLGSTVLRAVCEQLHPDASSGTAPPVTVAVNVSTAQLADPVFPHLVEQIITDADVRSSRICLEISERAMLERAALGSLSSVVATLAALKEIGVTLAIDDFGTGYSSLAHLRNFRVDILKIDRSFIAGLGRNVGDTSIVQAVIGLAHALNMLAIAEGVERPEQAERLRRMDCDQAQGHLYGRPVPSDGIASDATLRATQAGTGRTR